MLKLSQLWKLTFFHVDFYLCPLTYPYCFSFEVLNTFLLFGTRCPRLLLFIHVPVLEPDIFPRRSGYFYWEWYYKLRAQCSVCSLPLVWFLVLSCKMSHIHISRKIIESLKIFHLVINIGKFSFILPSFSLPAFPTCSMLHCNCI